MATDPKHKAKLLELRTKYQEWTKKYGDLGAIPEKEMLAKWWNGKETPPQTNQANISFENGKASVNCSTRGASIAYKKHWKDKSWEVYSKPINASQGDSLYILAHRIGFLPSEVLKIKVN